MRYHRQILMPQIGEEGQKKLTQARVAVIGTGGLGSAVLYYLAAAGVGTLSLFDSDTVELSNLNRQIIHWEQDIGRKKVASAAEKLSAFNTATIIHTYDVLLTRENANNFLQDHDVIVSCVDNKNTRFLLAQVGLELAIPVVEGGVEGLSGFQMNTKRDYACIGCLWGKEIQQAGELPIVGVIAGHIGTVQATQAIKIILNQHAHACFGKLWTFNLDAMHFETFDIPRDPNCPICGSFYTEVSSEEKG